MTFIDLTDSDFYFQCALSEDACECWDYDFLTTRLYDKYLINLSHKEIETLRENCKKILEATHDIHGGK